MYQIGTHFSHKKNSRLKGVLCGVVNKFLTNFDDFRAVYLFGIQADMEMCSETGL